MKEHIIRDERKGNDIVKKYTQEEFIEFEFKVSEGFKICPTGDYTAIKEFDFRCKFGNSCKFRKDCSFSDCRFGNGCEFGNSCNFDYVCKFGYNCKFCERCKFGDGCELGDYCEFGDECKFGHSCEFGADCTFGDICKFDEYCIFVTSCNYEDGKVVHGEFICFKNIGSNNREAYLYIDENKKLFLRAGCFFGDLEELNKHYKTEKTSSKITKQYLLLFETGKKFFEIND